MNKYLPLTISKPKSLKASPIVCSPCKAPIEHDTLPIVITPTQKLTLMQTISKTHKIKAWIKKIGIIGLILFLLKGLVWLFVVYFLVK
jgi:hypothetical protein